MPAAENACSSGYFCRAPVGIRYKVIWILTTLNLHIDRWPRLQLIGLLMVLLALSPCVVKKTVAVAFDTTYGQALSQNKTTERRTATCTSTSRDAQAATSQLIAVHLHQPFLSPPEVYIRHLSGRFGQAKLLKGVLHFRARSILPPRYILFQQLKIALH